MRQSETTDYHSTNTHFSTMKLFSVAKILCVLAAGAVQGLTPHRVQWMGQTARTGSDNARLLQARDFCALMFMTSSLTLYF